MSSALIAYVESIAEEEGKHPDGQELKKYMSTTAAAKSDTPLAVLAVKKAPRAETWDYSSRAGSEWR